MKKKIDKCVKVLKPILKELEDNSFAVSPAVTQLISMNTPLNLLQSTLNTRIPKNIIFNSSKVKSKLKKRLIKGRLNSAIRRSYNPPFLPTSQVLKIRKSQRCKSQFKNKISTINNHLRLSNFDSTVPISTVRLSSKGNTSVSKKFRKLWNKSML